MTHLGARLVRSVIRRTLSRLESRFISHFGAPQSPPIFVTGLPRVGSTLVYQNLVCGFDLAYMCNAAHRFAEAPALVTGILHRFHGVSPPATYASRYGVTEGWNAPSQSGETWGRWFPIDQSYTGAGVLDDITLRDMRSTVAAIESIFGRPFIGKAQGHAVRIHPLCEAFPKAVFVTVARDSLRVAESILRGRRDYFGSDGQWFSAKPSTYPALINLPVPEQIAGQIAGIGADMDRDLRQVGPDRVFRIDYDNFCRAPQRVLADFSDFYHSWSGTRLITRFDVPDGFSSSTEPLVPEWDSRLLRQALLQAKNTRE